MFGDDDLFTLDMDMDGDKDLTDLFMYNDVVSRIDKKAEGADFEEEECLEEAEEYGLDPDDLQNERGTK